MNNILNEFITGLKIGEDQVLGRLTIKPIINANSDYKTAVPFKTLDEAITDNVLEITEINTDGSVPELLVKNLGKSDIIILEGETVIGGKQNRSINSTFIIPAEAEIVIPVSCVERGRWHVKSARFASGGSVLYPSLRARSHRSVSRNLYANREYHSDQRGIWSDINLKGRRMSVSSPTDAMSDIEESTLGPKAQIGLSDTFRYQENQVGFLAFVDGGFAGSDIFGTPNLCEKLLLKLLKGSRLDALDSALEFPELTAQDIMREVAESDAEQLATLGRGEENRFETAKLTGSWKSLDGEFINLTVFPRSESQSNN